jgi:hypothetical protein
MEPWTRFVRFISEDGRELCGEPVDSNIDGMHHISFLRPYNHL